MPGSRSRPKLGVHGDVSREPQRSVCVCVSCTRPRGAVHADVAISFIPKLAEVVLLDQVGVRRLEEVFMAEPVGQNPLGVRLSLGRESTTAEPRPQWAAI